MGRNIIEVIIKADDKASAQLKTIASNAKGMGGAFMQAATIIASAGAIAATAMTAMILKTAEWADSLYDVSQRLGVSTEFLSQMEYALKTTGGELADFQVGMKLLAGTLQDAINGNAEAKKKFDALGLSIHDSSGKGLGASEMFMVLADRIARAKTSTEAMAIATDFFGRNALTLLPLLKLNSAGIKELMNRADELGGTLSGEGAAAADRYGDAVVDLKTSFKGVALAITGEFLPALTALNTFLASGIPEWWNFIRSINPFQKLIDNIAWVIDKVTRKGAPPATKFGPVLAHMPFADLAMDMVAKQYEQGQKSIAGVTAKTTEAIKDQYAELKKAMALFPAAPSPIEMSLLSCARATELWDAKTMDLAGNIVAVTGAYEKVAVPAMVNPFAAEWKAGLEEFDVHGMDIARDMTNTFGEMFAQIAQKGANAAQIFEQAWRAALGNIIAMLAKMFLWKIGGEIVGTAFGVPGGGGGAILGEGAGVGKGLGKSSSPSMSSAPAVNVNPLFFSGSRQDSYLAADYIQRRLDGNSRFVIEGSL